MVLTAVAENALILTTEQFLSNVNICSLASLHTNNYRNVMLTAIAELMAELLLYVLTATAEP